MFKSKNDAMKKPNILVAGSGAREAAFAKKLAQEGYKVYTLPGNPGMGHFCEIAPKMDSLNFLAVGEYCQKKEISIILVGPERYLADGIVDYFEASEEFRGITVIGPRQMAAMLESSKAYAKDFMKKFHIPSASYAVFKEGDARNAEKYIREHSLPVVLKASGLAAGKGVIICQSHNEAVDTMKRMLSGELFQDAGKEIVVEQFLSGYELSAFACVSKTGEFVLLPVATDYKRLCYGDTGPNTGGMGAIVVPVKKEISDQIYTIAVKTINGMKKHEVPYYGFLYLGLMVDDNGKVYVLEYNSRMGDPETEVVVPLIKNFGELVEQMAYGSFENFTLGVLLNKVSIAVVMTAEGYPGDPVKGDSITFLNDVFTFASNDPDTNVFPAGIGGSADSHVTNGGRVLVCHAMASSFDEAQSLVYEMVESIKFRAAFYRPDIGNSQKMVLEEATSVV